MIETTTAKQTNKNERLGDAVDQAELQPITLTAILPVAAQPEGRLSSTGVVVQSPEVVYVANFRPLSQVYLLDEDDPVLEQTPGLPKVPADRLAGSQFPAV